MADAEVERVRTAYAARRAVADRYDPRRADQVAIDAARRTAWGQWLLAHDRYLGATLEVGCGSGAVLRWAREVGGGPVVGADLIEDRLLGVRALNPTLGAVLGDGRCLPFDTASFDTVLCSTLFSSILDDDLARAVAAEIERVVKPTGIVLWFDFAVDNLRNPNVRGVSRARVGALFPGRRCDLRRAVLAPPVARRLVRAPRLAALLEVLPPLRTHLVGVLAPA